MWTEEMILGFAKDNLRDDIFSDGIPKLLDILEDPDKIPVFYTRGGNMKVRALPPYCDDDRVTVVNFTLGLRKVQKELESDAKFHNKERQLDEKKFARYYFQDATDYHKVLSVWLGWAHFHQTLEFTERTSSYDPISYQACVEPSMSKDWKIMDCHGWPNRKIEQR